MEVVAKHAQRPKYPTKNRQLASLQSATCHLCSMITHATSVLSSLVIPPPTQLTKTAELNASSVSKKDVFGAPRTTKLATASVQSSTLFRTLKVTWVPSHLPLSGPRRVPTWTFPSFARKTTTRRSATRIRSQNTATPLSILTCRVAITTS